MTDLFTDDNPTITTIDPNVDHFSSLVGDDKKFKTPQDLARAKVESDAFIKRLETENAQMREELRVQQRLEELLKKPSETGTQSQNNQQGASENQTALTPEQIEAIVTKSVDKLQTSRNQQNNLNEVKTALTSHFGSDYAAALNAEIDKLGITKEFANNLAATQPKAFLKLFIPEKTHVEPTLFTPPSSTVNVSTSSPTGARNFAFYEKIRKTNSAEYWSPKVQNQLHRDALAQGASFYT